MSTVPFGERCFRGCGRRADVRVALEQFCARCYLEKLDPNEDVDG